MVTVKPSPPIQPNSYVATKSSLAWQFLPSKIVPIIKKFIRNDFLGASPYASEIHLTSECNLKCKDCSYKERNMGGAFLKIDKVFEIYNWLNHNNAYSILFSGGGEPLLWPFWKKLIPFLAAKNNAIKLGLATNGVGLPEIFNDNLNLFNIIQISIYGYDQISGFSNTLNSNYFRDIRRSLDYVFSKRNTNVQLSAKITINRFNVLQISKYLDFVVNWPFDAIIAKVVGSFEGPRGLALNRDEITSMNDMLGVYQWPSCYDKKLSNLLSFANYSQHQHYSKCEFRNSRLYTLIRSTGEIYLCVCSADDRHLSIGNVNVCNELDPLFDTKYKIVKSSSNEPDNQHKKCRIEICRHAKYNCYFNGEYDDVCDNRFTILL